MAGNRSFKDYVINTFYNELYAATEGYVAENLDRLDLDLRKVRSIGEVALTDLEVKWVSVNDLPDMKIEFDVIVEAGIMITEGDYHYDDYDAPHKWFALRCSGDLDRSLVDFEIASIRPYDYRNKNPKPMSDALVPIIYKEDLEAVATEFLTKHYPEALQEPIAVEPEVLAKRMGLHLEVRHITEDMSIFGQVFFHDAETELYDADRDELVTTSVSARTIFVDPEAYFLRNLGAVNNTIVHECVHWDKHRKAFELERLYNSSASRIKCQVVGGMKGSERNTKDWMEWQANALAPRIQMPFHAAKIKASEFIRKHLALAKTTKYIDVMEPVIDEMVAFFAVSRQAAKIRMYDIGYEEAAGAFIFLDGRYVRPHAFKKGFLKPNQTFSISFRDAIVAGVVDPELREAREQGLFLFVDSHFCINDPKYIAYDELGNPHLTDYARYHMDECCLVFDLSIDSPANSYQKEFFWECVLCRDVNADIVFVANYSESAQNQTVHERAKMMGEYNQEISSVLRMLPSSFPEALVELMRWRKITVESLSEAANVSTKTIQRLRNDPDYTSSLEMIVAVCIGLKLPPTLSRALMDRSGFSLKGTETHLAYDFLLTGYYTATIFDCNAMLVAQNIEPLGEKTKK